MITHYELPDKYFEISFRECRLDPALFDHEAHLRLAWIHIKNYGIDKAIENICEQLSAYVTNLGKADKFNKTLTIAAVRALYSFYLRSSHTDFREFVHEFPQLKSNFKDLMASHYSFDIYFSEEAKRSFLEPDLLPFP